MSGDSGYDTSRYQTVQVSFLLCRKLIILEVVNYFPLILNNYSITCFIFLQQNVVNTAPLYQIKAAWLNARERTVTL